MKVLVQKAIDTALSQDGVREVGDNAGKKVEEYLRAVGLGGGNPWCAAFVYWSIETAAKALKVANPFIRTAGCAVIAGWAKAHDLLEDLPASGDVFLRWGTVDEVYRASHTGFVLSASGAKFRTIEGNTNLTGSRQGIGVFSLPRTNSDRYHFVRWSNLVEENETEVYTLILGDADSASPRAVCDMPVRGGRALCPIREWGKALGFKLDWNQHEQIPLFDGKEVHTEVVLLGNNAYAPVRDLVQSAGLQIKVDVANHKVYVTH